MELNVIGIQAGNFNLNLNVGAPLNFFPPFNLNEINTRNASRRCVQSKNDAEGANVIIYNNMLSLRYNYLHNLSLIEKYRAQLYQLQQSFMTANTDVFSFNQVFNGNFFANGENIAERFKNYIQINRLYPDNDDLFKKGVTEFIQYLEIKLMSYFHIACENSLMQGNIGIESFRYMVDMISNPNKIEVNKSLQELFKQYFNGPVLSNLTTDRWSNDLKRILDFVVDAIRNSFQGGDESDFLRLLPLLKTSSNKKHTISALNSEKINNELAELRQQKANNLALVVPDGLSPAEILRFQRRKNARNLQLDFKINQLSNENNVIKPYLTLLFSIIMIRLPTQNIANEPMIREKISLPYKEIAGGAFLYKSTPVEISNIKQQKLFYFIPKHQRVVGIWRRESVVQNENGHNYFAWDYNTNAIRNVILRIPAFKTSNRVPIKLEYQHLFNVNELFENNAQFQNYVPVRSLYEFVRKQNPFNIQNDKDKYTRLYVNVEIYASGSRPVLYVPFTLEGRPGTRDEYDYSKFLEKYHSVFDKYQEVLDGEDSTEIYIYICFLWDRSLPVYNPEEDYGGGDEEFKDGQNNNQNNENRGNNYRTPQKRSRNAPLPPVELVSSNAVPDFLVGAPHVGTKKEKHFLNGSLINLFIKNEALFRIPETEKNLCFLMSLIKSQVYQYIFENKKCKQIKLSGINDRTLLSDEVLIESIYDYSDRTEDFIKNENGISFIKLFSNKKHKKEDNTYYEGVINDEETVLLEKIAEELWFNLEVSAQNNIDYRNIKECGQVFCDLFNVCIAIYDVELRGKRVHILSPSNLPPASLVERFNEINIVHILYDRGHCHAITNYRQFSKNDTRKEELRIHQYCPICDKKCIRELDGNKEKAFDHISKCAAKEKFKINFDDEIINQAEITIRECQVVIKKEKKGNKFQKFEKSYQCCHCYQPITQESYMSHICYIKKTDNIALLEDKIYVYDLECAQLMTNNGLLKHECNCLYIRKVYCSSVEEEQGEYFSNEIAFIDHLKNNAELFKGTTWIAHNGGAYDVYFLLTIFERENIMHTFIPSPTSKHKFIEIYLVDYDIRFIDFMRFIPSSLKNIAISFGISVSKGDFPHKFNNGLNDEYVGRIPPVDDENDYWGIKSYKSEENLESFQKWYNEMLLVYCSCDNECDCEKQKWDFQNEIKKYCQLDVIVLAKIIEAYRNECMNFENVLIEGFAPSSVKWEVTRMDPFTCLTLPQTTIRTLINGFSEWENKYKFKGITTYHHRQRGGKCNAAHIWIRQQEIVRKEFIFNSANSLKEYYDFDLHMPFDGYSPSSHTIFFFKKCSYWGCPNCMLEYFESSYKLPERNLYANDVKEQLQKILEELHKKYNEVVHIWECEYNTSFFNEYTLECSRLFNPMECFYGGRTDTFSLQVNIDKINMFLPEEDQEEIKYYDVTSLYPYCYTKMLPIGTPFHLVGSEIDLERLHPTASNRYFGFVKVKIIPKYNDLIGLLPQRDKETGRLFFPVHPMVGCWFCDEIYLALQNGYIIEHVYELYHWEADERSDEHFRGYVDYYLRMKQEAEGWKKLGASSDCPNEQEKDDIVERLFIQNGNLGRIRKEKVKKNPVLRALAKLYLNSLWGKFAQKPSKVQHMTVYGSSQFFNVWNNPKILQEKCSFREISIGVFKTSYTLKPEFVNVVGHANVWIAATVTATARTILHSQMLLIGPEKIIYCDTDSIICRKRKLMGELTGVGLGKWVDEYPYHKIKSAYVLAPKMYSLTLIPNNGEAEYETIKAKGVQLTIANQELLKYDRVKILLEKLIKGEKSDYSISVENFNIYSNSTNNNIRFGEVFSRYNKKQVRPVITKRIFKKMEEFNIDESMIITTYPIGYNLD